MVILTFVNFYLPGYRGGGPAQSLANLVEHLGDEFTFKIITTDRDFGDQAPYPGITGGEWHNTGNAQVLYVPEREVSFANLRRILVSTKYDVLYLNSFFHRRFTIRPLLLRWARLVPRKPVVIAPRGEFSAGALALKQRRKEAYIEMAKALDLYSRVIWQASSDHEEVDIRRSFGLAAQIQHAPIMIAPDLVPRLPVDEPFADKPTKRAGTLKLVFVSRICRKKNLLGAITALQGLRGNVEFSVYGPLEDKYYWKECQEIIRSLPPTVRVEYKGELAHNQVVGAMAQCHLLFFPTWGENFGHVILEALTAGCPILISDTTPWRDLAGRGIGWDLPLGDDEAFRRALQTCIDMVDFEYIAMSERARNAASIMRADVRGPRLNRELFEAAYAVGSGRRQMGFTGI